MKKRSRLMLQRWKKTAYRSPRSLRYTSDRRVSKLPCISGRDCVKAPAGSVFWNGGSTVVTMSCGVTIRSVSFIPDHKELDRGTLRAIIRSST